MNSYFKSNIACNLYEELKKPSLMIMGFVNELNFSESRKANIALSEIYLQRKTNLESSEEDLLNDLYVLNRFVTLLQLYSELWEAVINGKFSNSWNILQNSLDSIRCIKKFSQLNVSYFEEQLLELEESYPYKIFFSIGATVEKFECSICGLDIDSADCRHRKGELYSGQMAVAIAKNISNFDHVAMVLIPEDKRCVVTYDDNSEQFELIRYLSNLILNRKILISDFKGFSYSVLKEKNPEFIKQNRNEICNCGSGKKFKNCCINTEYIDCNHVEIIAENFCVAHTIV